MVITESSSLIIVLVKLNSNVSMLGHCFDYEIFL